MRSPPIPIALLATVNLPRHVTFAGRQRAIRYKSRALDCAQLTQFEKFTLLLELSSVPSGLQSEQEDTLPGTRPKAGLQRRRSEPADRQD